MGQTNPKISIVIPTYNHREALERCLASINAQTFQDFEVIIVDDASTDTTCEWLNAPQPPLKIRGGDGGVMKWHMIRHAENKGAPAARNTGLREAKGEYVLFCDADVEMQPNMLERMMRTLAEHAEASYAYCSFQFGWKIFKLFSFDADRLRRMPYVPSMSLVRRAHVPKNGWDESLRKLQDWDFFLTMLEEGHTGVWIPEILYRASPHRGGISLWLPSFLYKIPWLPSVRLYRQAERTVKIKHRLE